MVLPPFTLHRPHTVDEALALLDDESVPYAGGTELLMAMKMGLMRPAALVDLKRVADLAGIRVVGGELYIGAGCTHDAIAGNDLIAEHAPLLASAERLVGNARVRAQGTVGGNICFAEPRSDVATVIIALNASLILQRGTERRTVPAHEFFLGPYWTIREPDELLLAITVPLPAPAGVYVKFQTVERPTVAVAAVRLPAGGIRIVIGAVSDLPVWSDVASVADIDAEDLVSRIEPVADLVGSERYKRHVTGVFVRRAIVQLEESA